MKGNWKVKQDHLRPLHTKAKDALRELPKWSIRHVKRDENERADELLNEALDSATKWKGRARPGLPMTSLALSRYRLTPTPFRTARTTFPLNGSVPGTRLTPANAGAFACM